MNEGKFLTCPNCGANITNTQNCEYCGSLLVRFVDKGIDLSTTTYLDNSRVSNKLIKALQLSLQMQEQEQESVVMDIWQRKGKNAYRYLNCVLRRGFCAFADHTRIPCDTDKGLCIIWGDDLFSKEEYKRFMSLDCFPLFTERSCIVQDKEVGKFNVTEFYIDFGSDAEGAARLLTDIFSKVYGLSDEDLECAVNTGRNVEESRKYYREREGLNIGGLIAAIVFIVASVFLLIVADGDVQMIVTAIAGLAFCGYWIFKELLKYL